jgi:hypothetical protein
LATWQSNPPASNRKYTPFQQSDVDSITTVVTWLQRSQSANSSSRAVRVG